MNVDRIRQLADHIEKLPYVPARRARKEVPSFSMRWLDYNCGTPACIAGWAIEMWPEKDTTERSLQRARVCLDVWGPLSKHLFVPEFPSANYDAKKGQRGHITPAHAAACLRKLAETGEVDWEGTKP